MNIVNDNKYKDDSPIVTVNKIRQILHGYNLIPIESNWKNSAVGYYSLSVSIKGTELSTNGKGTTPEYALASAYGELMERLQNQSFFRLAIDVSQEAVNYHNFYYAPDEYSFSFSEFMQRNDEWTRAQIAQLNSNTGLNKLLNKWKSISYEDTPNDFVTIPYLNLMTRNISYIPVKMVSKMYMSNGMCAGNTIEEALVQGISEVFERYVNRKILLEKLCLPTIPQEFLNKYPRIVEMMSNIERNGNYKVIMKDCSLGKNYPVVSAIYINRDDQTYFVKFGSHPQIEIAMERTLTELLQGQDVKRMRGVKEYSYNPPILDDEKNLMGILVNGSGYYPSRFFSQDFDYQFSGFSVPKGTSNRDMLIYLLKLLYRDNLNAYVRDLSYLGFPSYHVIVPGFSEVEKFDDYKTLDEYAGFIKIKKYIRNLNQLNDNDIKECLQLMDNNNIQGNASIPRFLSFNITDQVPWYYNSIDLFKVALNYKIKNYKEAYSIFDNYLNRVMVNLNNKDTYTYYKCVRDYIGSKINNSTERESINALEYLYPKDMINDVIEKFRSPNNILNIYGSLHCWECDKCSMNKTCSYQNIEKVYKKLKDIYYINYIDQRSMIRQLNL